MPIDMVQEIERIAVWPAFGGFLLVLARVGSALVFVPLPGLRSGSEIPRIVLVLGISAALHSRWMVPTTPTLTPAPMTLIAWLVAECCLGILMGVALSLILDAYQFGAQMVGLQAGFSYASTIDPSNDTDSGVLLILVQLLTGLLFLALGLDRQILEILAASFDRIPPGAVAGSLPSETAARIWTHGANELLRLGTAAFSTGIRLALPVVVLLLLVDIALAMLSRLEQQVQLSGILFPAKTLGAFLAVGAVLPGVSWLFESSAKDALNTLRELVAPR